MTGEPPVLDVDAIIADPTVRTVVCCGAGGVGKTTTAASIAVRAAEAGRRVAVLTIDPARRLAQALGLEEMGNEPVAVPTIDTSGSGSLDAMMLDMKRTFDEVVVTHAAPDKVEQILANPFYQAVSSSFAGTQEYMAMERLGQLIGEEVDGRPRWDLIVVDTPPSRSALDFLDAPKRLGSFLDGRFIRLLLAPARVGGKAYVKVVSVGMGAVTSAMSKILGAQFLQDMQTFVAALDTMFGGFRERAEQTYALLKAPGTAFVVVATPERDALREASYFIDRLAEEDMPLAGLVANRVQMTYVPSLSGARALAAAEQLEAEPAEPQQPWTRADSAGLLRVHADLDEQGTRHAAAIGRFVAAHPDIALVQVPAGAHDVNDVQELREIGDYLAGQ
ncbi:anion-transporting ArsA/GET3 family ATPase [Barrientosiimonas humi]|uniref:Anion-transporting ArsA/GET3 family ATPase n=1 Tax=Barrientosiimonas humi TaxID=999931 RepID=A0A542WZR7_9MICO|nr:ArsA family ATPase [Barrientosiimonas humi]TQL29071.1 anion-transporting ArsA/GET3 family ATPase [Barrientosiimonas humi]CAG7571604.1 Arsenical pump-driving ATPase [Barrientosiimonas humi]